jgi:tetratricopeptide (TPR) repeat protein
MRGRSSDRKSRSSGGHSLSSVVLFVAGVAGALIVILVAAGVPWWTVTSTAAGFAAGIVGAVIGKRRSAAHRTHGYSRLGQFRRARRGYVVPHESPPPPPDFYGRGQDLARLRSLFTDRREGGTSIALIIGAAGVGKTALATQFAAQHWDLFPDGQLFAQLGHADSDSSPTSTLLYRFIKAIGSLDDRVPESHDDRLRLYRSLTAHWRGLVIIDDACHVDCVKDLVPLGHSAATIVTSQRDLATLPAGRIELVPLQESDAIDLLESVIGEHRVQGDRLAASKIAAGGHPLSVRLAGSALADRPYLSLEEAVTRMEEQRPLPLETPNAILNGKLDLSYALLSREERKVIRCLGLLSQSVISPWELAALLGVKEDDAVRLADNVAKAQLIRRTSGGRAGIVRFELHEHVLEYARARMRAETVAQNRRQRIRALDVARESRRQSAANLAWHLNVTIPTFKDAGELDKALDEARDALSIAEESGRKRETAEALALLSDLYVELGNTNEAMQMAEASLHTDEPYRPIRALRSMGKILRRMRRLDHAQGYLSEALTKARDAEDVSEQIRILIEQSAALALTAERSRSVTIADEALELCGSQRDYTALRSGAQWAAANAWLSSGEPRKALELLDQAAPAASDDQALWRAWIYWLRGKAAFEIGDLGKAAESQLEAIDSFGTMAHRYGVAYCRLALGRVYVTDESGIGDAIALLTDALETFQNCNDLWTQGDAEHVLGLAMLRAGQRADAIRLLQDAERTFAELGDDVSLFAVIKDLELLRKGGNGRAPKTGNPKLASIRLRKGN